jgi:conjugal transfer pilus assembly protein TraE
MKLSRLSATWDRTLWTNAILLVANAALAVGLAAAAVVEVTRHERVVLVPPGLDERAQVAWKAASAEYFKAWGLYVATLVGNVTPNNVSFVADSLSPLFSPRIYASVRTQILALAKDPVFGRATAVNYFSPTQAIYEPATGKVFIVGTIVTSTFEKTGETRHVVYEMKWRMQAGLPLVVEFTSYEGSQPKTLKWLESQQGTAGPQEESGKEERGRVREHAR